MWSPLSISDVATPVLKIWYFCGLSTFNFENGLFKSKKSNIFLIALILIIIGLAVYCKLFGVRNYIMFSHIFCVYLENFVLIWFSHFRRKKITWILNELLTLEKHLTAFSGTIIFVTVGKKFIQLVLFQIFSVIVVVILVLLILDYQLLQTVFVTMYYGAMICSFNFGYFLYFYLLCLREMFRHFNLFLKNKIIFKSSKIYFRKICFIYLLICNLSKNVNKCFQLIILFKICIDFIIGVTIFYLGIYSLRFANSIVAGLFLLSASGLALTAVLTFSFSLAYLFDELLTQVKLLLFNF